MLICVHTYCPANYVGKVFSRQNITILVKVIETMYADGSGLEALFVSSFIITGTYSNNDETRLAGK